jgi:3-oxoacyl-[acyl-carrier protein] reductase
MGNPSVCYAGCGSFYWKAPHFGVGLFTRNFAMAHLHTAKVALVTGAGRGIGRAIAVRLARDSALVVVNDTGSDEHAQETVVGIESAGGKAVAMPADVSRVAEVKRLFDTCFEKFGRLDILVNNAGMMFTRHVVDVTEEEFDRIFAVNVKGTFFCAQEAAKRMTEGGRIINISSTSTALMMPGYGAYVATKGAVEQFSRILARELGPRKITVNVLSPGPTNTELFNRGKSEEQRQRFAQMAALGRLGQPEDIASVVALLVSEDANWITGQIIRANGGVI